MDKRTCRLTEREVQVTESPPIYSCASLPRKALWYFIRCGPAISNTAAGQSRQAERKQARELPARCSEGCGHRGWAKSVGRRALVETAIGRLCFCEIAGFEGAAACGYPSVALSSLPRCNICANPTALLSERLDAALLTATGASVCT